MSGSIKKVISLVACLATIISCFSACANPSDDIYNKNISSNVSGTATAPEQESSASNKNSGESSEAKELNGTLKICQFLKSNLLFDWADEFIKLHPQVNIEFVGSTEDDENYIEKLRVQLMSGNVADLIDTKVLSYYSIAKSGLFEDLYPYIEKDSSFNLDNYYINVLETMEYDDELYTLLGGVAFPYVRLNTSVTDALGFNLENRDSISFSEIYELYSGAIERGIVDKDSFTLSHYLDQTVFNMSAYTDYIDEKNNIADFNSAKFVTYLNQINGINWDLDPSLQWTAASRQNFLPDDELLLYALSMFANKSDTIAFKPSKSASRPLYLETENGKRVFQLSDFNSLVIASDSPNKELAWEFIKFLVEEKDLSDAVVGENYMDYGIPINKTNAKQLLYKSLADFDNKDEIYTQINEWVNSIDTYSFIGNLELVNAFESITKEFYEGRITAEDCAQQMQNRAEIYLKE